MVQIENLYSNWNYDVMYTLAFPLGGGVQKVSSSKYERGCDSVESGKAGTYLPWLHIVIWRARGL